MRVEKRNRKFGSFFGNHLSGSFIMSVAKEFTTDRNTDVKTAGNRVIEGCNSLLVAYTRDSFKVRAGLPTENKKCCIPRWRRNNCPGGRRYKSTRCHKRSCHFRVFDKWEIASMKVRFH